MALRLVDTHDDRVIIRYGAAPAQPTKSGKIRTVYLNGRAKEALTAWLVALPAYTANRRHPEGRNPLGLAFPGRRGAFRNEEHVLRWADWQAILERAKLGRDFRWHDLRHTCASALVSGWWGRRWSLEEVREVLGHQDLKTTQRYAHLAGDAIASAAHDTPGFIGQGIGQAPELDRKSSLFFERDTGLEPATFGLGKPQAFSQDGAWQSEPSVTTAQAAGSGSPGFAACSDVSRGQLSPAGDSSSARAFRALSWLSLQPT